MASQSAKSNTPSSSKPSLPVHNVKTGPDFFEASQEKKAKKTLAAPKRQPHSEDSQEKPKRKPKLTSSQDTQPAISKPMTAADLPHKASMKKTTSPQRTKKTKIIVKFDCGMPNELFIRGEGVATLNWDKGEPLLNIAADEWMWESERPFTEMEFKILINDSQYESGENHRVQYGATEIISPRF